MVAQGIAFTVSCVEVPAGEPITVEFDNQDEGQSHNVAVYPRQDELTTRFATPDTTIIGPDTIEYQVEPLEEGDYYFQCDVHPQMQGTWSAVEGGGGGGDGGDGGGETGATGPTATGATGTTGQTGATGATG